MKKLVCFILACALSVCVFGFSASATDYKENVGIAFSKQNNVVIGDQIKVTITYTAGYGTMQSITGDITYNNAVLQYVSSSENTADHGGSISVARSFGQTNTDTISITFKAIAAGEGSVSCDLHSFSGVDSDKGDATGGAAVTVTEAKPSNNANLGSLSISDGNLTPAFKAATTKYTATVKYPVEKITIKANAAVGDSKVTGAGTFDIKVGESKHNITVTAASGDKKTYTITVKRMTEEETAAAEEEERSNNPFLFACDGKDRLIVPDLSAMEEFEGFELSSFESKNEKIDYLSDKSGKYNLIWATDPSGADGAFYNKTKDGKYIRINCLQTENRIFIIEPFEDDINVSSQFIATTYKIGEDSINCYRYSNADLSDFYVFYCYFNGKSNYYMYDAAQNTVQREPTFTSTVTNTEAVEPEGIIERFGKLNIQAKVVLLLLLFAAVLVVLLVILLIVKAASGRKKHKRGEDDFTLADIDFDSVSYETEEMPGQDVTDKTEVLETAGEDADTADIADTVEPAEETDPRTQELGAGETEAAESGAGETDASEFLDPEDDF